MPNKIKFIECLRANQNNKVDFSQLLVIANQLKITLYEARRFLLSKYPSLDFGWNTILDEELVIIAEQCFAFTLKHRPEWDKLSQQYQKHQLKYHQSYEKIRKRFNLDRHITKEALLQQLRKSYEHSKASLKASEGSPQKIAQAEHQQLKSFVHLLQHIIQYELEEQKYIKIDDHESIQVINKLFAQLNASIQANINDSLEAGRNQLKTAQMIYKGDIEAIKQNLEQIFLYYCRESNQNGSDFETYQKISQLLDLRFCLRYFKDLNFVQHDSNKFSEGQLTQLFKKMSTQGRCVNFRQFWGIHKKLFGIQDLKNKNKPGSSTSQILNDKEIYEMQIQKMKQLSSILTAERVEQKINSLSIPGLKLMKIQPSILPKLAPTRQRSLSQNKINIQRKQSFIQQIRHQISTQNLSIRRSSSVQDLPNILKIPSKKIESQGIYSSLKRFANFDYLAQEKKIKSIIGLSVGEDEQFMQAYFKKQGKVKNLKIKEKQKIKKASESPHKGCKKHRPQEIQPYMRF